MKILAIIGAICIGIWLLKKILRGATKAAVKNIKWGSADFIQDNVKSISQFQYIVSDFLAPILKEGITITKNREDIGDIMRIAGRNHIYHSVKYNVGDVYMTSVKSGESSIILVFIWIDQGWTHDDAYELTDNTGKTNDNVNNLSFLNNPLLQEKLSKQQLKEELSKYDSLLLYKLLDSIKKRFEGVFGKAFDLTPFIFIEFSEEHNLDLKTVYESYNKLVSLEYIKCGYIKDEEEDDQSTFQISLEEFLTYIKYPYGRTIYSTDKNNNPMTLTVGYPDMWFLLTDKAKYYFKDNRVNSASNPL